RPIHKTQRNGSLEYLIVNQFAANDFPEWVRLPQQTPEVRTIGPSHQDLSAHALKRDNFGQSVLRIEQKLQILRQAGEVLFVKENPSAAQHFFYGGLGIGEDREPLAHGLQNRQAESFVFAHADIDRRCSI